MTMKNVVIKLFALSLKEDARMWFKNLDDIASILGIHLEMHSWNNGM
jgi:hypothetical protein